MFFSVSRTTDLFFGAASRNVLSLDQHRDDIESVLSPMSLHAMHVLTEDIDRISRKDMSDGVSRMMLRPHSGCGLVVEGHPRKCA